MSGGEKQSGVMRILFVTNMYPSPERQGYGAFVWQQAEQLRRCGHVIDVVNIRGFQSYRGSSDDEPGGL